MSSCPLLFVDCNSADRCVYCCAVHIVVEHSADLMQLQGKDGGLCALGYWSQQGFEAFHKVTKTTWSRATNHCGGHETDTTSSSFQIMKNHVRKFVYKARKHSSVAMETGMCSPKVSQFVHNLFAPSRAEQVLEVKTREATHNRYKQHLISKADEGSRARKHARMVMV